MATRTRYEKPRSTRRLPLPRRSEKSRHSISSTTDHDGHGRHSRVRKSITIVKRALGVTHNEDEQHAPVVEREKLENGDVPDIGIDFEEQTHVKDLAQAEERDRVLNQGLLIDEYSRSTRPKS